MINVFFPVLYCKCFFFQPFHQSDFVKLYIELGSFKNYLRDFIFIFLKKNKNTLLKISLTCKSCTRQIKV